MSGTVKMLVPSPQEQSHLRLALAFQNACWLILHGPDEEKLRNAILTGESLEFHLAQVQSSHSGSFMMRVHTSRLADDDQHLELEWTHQPPLCGICSIRERHPLMAVSEILNAPINGIRFYFRPGSNRYNPRTNKGSCHLISVDTLVPSG